MRSIVCVVVHMWRFLDVVAEAAVVELAQRYRLAAQLPFVHPIYVRPARPSAITIRRLVVLLLLACSVFLVLSPLITHTISHPLLSLCVVVCLPPLHSPGWFCRRLT